MNIEDHPLAKTLPRATKGPSLQLGPEVFREFAASKNAPETLEDFVYTDSPQLSLFITSFNNATLVALSWPHTLMDVMGQQALLHGWSLVLAGRETEVPRVLGARDDAICAAAEASIEGGEKAEEYSLGGKQLKGWAMAKFGLRFAGDLLWNRVVETRTIFLPKDVVVGMRRQAEEELSKLASQDSTTEETAQDLFISEGDVLTAWSLKAVASSLPQPRPVAALHALNARFRLSSLAQAQKQTGTQPSGGVFLQNMAVAAFTFISPDVAVGPLGPIALENRRHLMEQATEPQVLAYLRELRKDSKHDPESDSDAPVDPATMLYCDSDALLMPFTNWTRADFFKTLDFSPALVRAGDASGMEHSRTNPPGTIVSHHAQSMRQSPTVRNVIVILGKDHAGNYWLTGTLLPQAWAKIEEDLKRR